MTYEEIVSALAPLGLRPATSADSPDALGCGVDESACTPFAIAWLREVLSSGDGRGTPIRNLRPGYIKFVFDPRGRFPKSVHAKPLPLP